MKFPIVIHKDTESDFSVTVPDLPGCFSAGSTVEEAMDMSREAIECHIEGILIDNEPIPIVSAIEQHQQNEDFKDGIWAIIDVDLSKLSIPSKSVNIEIPEILLNTVDNYARKHGKSRSSLLTQAVTEYISTH
ncbi:type II toxin-antitoxin system HicB family antitoxin [Candidatus Marithrix sp. Canyon 246]|uniref:type II toxin-antitoxin system HicB family antitoxin n=1 Tax=Candidatus Marithrix sp. Canyon 246 TaxID=1827136 RepID=UPI000849F79E|nr:type II toxin-antitoxin system HicB family antitoxin [Candidatus Marithrix sp. Canyon 246]